MLLRRLSALIFLFLASILHVGLVPAFAEQGNPTQAALACRDSIADINQFAGCWSREMMSDQQRLVADCLSQSGSLGAFAFCATQHPLNPQDQRIAECALQSGGNFQTAAACAGMQYLSPDQQQLAGCIFSNGLNAVGAAVCAGGKNLTPEQTVVAPSEMALIRILLSSAAYA